MGAIWAKIYSPPVDIDVVSVSSNQSTTPASNNIKYIPGPSVSVPVSYSYKAPVGGGRCTLAYGTRYEYRQGPSTLKFENTSASITYFVKIKHTTGELGMICGSESRQKDVLQILSIKKQIKVRFLLGMLVIPELNYNAWLDIPELLVMTVSVPIMIIAVLASRFI